MPRLSLSLSRRDALASSGVLIVALVALGWWLSVQGGEHKDLAWAHMKSAGVLRVGLDPSYPPFEWQDETTGKLQGYDVDLAREIGKRLGVQVSFIYVGFDSLLDAVRTGKVDAVVSGMPYDSTQTQSLSFGVWYFNAGQYLAVRTGNSAVRTVNDLAGRRLGVELGSTGDLEARRLQAKSAGLAVETFHSADEALKALSDGKVDAALVDAISAYAYISQGGQVALVGNAVLDESYAAVTDYRSTQLRSAIDSVILQLKSDGFLDGLRDKWLLKKGQ
jgi:ABC-type amino acid transport substrate-binding protein